MSCDQADAHRSPIAIYGLARRLASPDALTRLGGPSGARHAFVRDIAVLPGGDAHAQQERRDVEGWVIRHQSTSQFFGVSGLDMRK
jgi:hypothetical protein